VIPSGCNCSWRVAIRALIIVAIAGAAAFAGGAQPPSAHGCPKLLMFDGVQVSTQTNEAMAKYWGETIGVEGFYLNDIMASWDVMVGDDEQNVRHYQALKQFQELYSKYGVRDNFIKVAMYDPHDWRDPAAQDRVVSNFRQAAHLARFAGLKGIAFDLEPQAKTKGVWEVDPALPEKNKNIHELAKRIGAAILSQFPEAVIIVLPEILDYTTPPYPEKTSRAYALAFRFWDGLVQAHFAQLIIATENSYDSAQPARYVSEIRAKYRDNLLGNGVNPESLPVALGIWPLAKTYTDKSARSTPEQFQERLQEAFQEAVRDNSPYVWIYGHGSAWQTDGPYGKGSVDPHFNEFVRVVHRVKEQCAKGR